MTEYFTNVSVNTVIASEYDYQKDSIYWWEPITIEDSISLYNFHITNSGGAESNFKDVPSAAIKPDQYNSGWIPVARTDDGALLVDLNPAAKGKVGQVFEWYSDSSKRSVKAESITALVSKW